MAKNTLVTAGVVIKQEHQQKSTQSFPNQSIEVRHFITPVAQSLVPAGAILPYAGAFNPNPPAGFLPCSGGVVSRTLYANLFAIVGTSFNTGGEATTDFRLPDLRGRSLIGAGTYLDTVSGSVTRTLGQALGAEKHRLTKPEMPGHDHGGSTGSTDVGHTHTYTVNGGLQYCEGGSDVHAMRSPTGTNTGHTALPHTHTIPLEGGDGAHNNMQPSLVVNFMIKY